MSGFFTDLYVGAKKLVKQANNAQVKCTKYLLEAAGFDSDTEVYKTAAKASHIKDALASGVTETIEFILKRPEETGGVLSDLVGWAIGSDKLDSKRLLNYLYNYSKETGIDAKALLKELSPEILSDCLKYINYKLSDMKKIPCSQVLMDIALSDPKNIRTSECRTVDKSTMDRVLAPIKDSLSNGELDRYNEDLPLVMFTSDSKHAKLLQENKKMKKRFKKWINTPINDRKKSFSVALEVHSDPKNGYDSYASFHNVNVINPTLDSEGNLHAYVYDIYDFERASFNGQMLDFATIMAFHLQETGHIQNYKMLIPITIPASELN